MRTCRAWLLACLFLLMPLAHGNDVRIGIESRAPLFSIATNGAPTGLYVDVLRQLTDSHNWIIEFVPGSHGELVGQFHRQELTVLLGYHDELRLESELDILTPPLLTVWHQVFRPAPSFWQRWTEPPWQSIQELSGQRLGALAKSSALFHTQALCRLLIKPCDVVVFDAPPGMLTALHNRHIAAIVADSISAVQFHFNQATHTTPLMLAPMQIGLAVSANAEPAIRTTLLTSLQRWQSSRSPAYRALLRYAQPLPPDKAASLPLQFLVVGLGIGLLLGLMLIWLVKHRHHTHVATVSATSPEQENRRYQLLLNSIPYGLQEIDLKGRILFSNAAEHQIRRYRPGELLGRSIYDMLAFEREKKDLQNYFRTALKEQPPPDHYYCTILRKDGELAELRVEWNYKRDNHGHINGFFGLVTDVTESQQLKQRIVDQQIHIKEVAQQRVADLKQAYNDLLMAATVFEHTNQGILLLKPDTRVESANPAFLKLSGYSEEELPNLNLQSFAAERHGPQFHAQLETNLRSKYAWQGELWLLRKNRRVYPNWVAINAVLDADDKVKQYVALFTDITRLKKAEQQIWRQAHYDNLTNLPNRNLFYQRLNQTVENKQQQAALMFIDLDRFKEVNDTLGHDAGDDLLKQVAQRLQGCLRKEDLVARIGGDEFTVIMAKVDETVQVEAMAKQILKALATPFELQLKTVTISGSVGIVLFPEQADNMVTLLKNADIAMYQAKEGGRDAFRIFTP